MASILRHARQRRAVLLIALLAAGVIAFVARPDAARPEGASQASTSWPVSSLPARPVVPIGASGDEVWAFGRATSATVATPDKATGAVLLRQRGDGDWEYVSRVLRRGGEPESTFPVASAGPTPARVTPRGGIVLAGTDETVYVRDPGGPLRAVESPTSLLGTGQRLVGGSRATVAAVDEGSATGAFVAPIGDTEDRVLYHGAAGWTEERFDPAITGGNVKIAAIAGTGPTDMWLTLDQGNGVELYRRDTSAATPVWKKVTLSGAKSFITAAGARPLAYPAEGLTSAGDGLWIDARATVGGAMRDVVMFFDTSSRQVTRTWCDDAACDAKLGISLGGAPTPQPDGTVEGTRDATTRGYRSFAWDGASFGTRVITNPDLGISPAKAGGTGYAVFDGASFTAVRAGATRLQAADGAFTSPSSGWMAGNLWSVIRVAPAAPPARLQAYPAPSSRPFRAVVPEPGRSAGDPGAQALAVGDDGRVARYSPERGWVAEQLPTSSGRATPRLRGVAWPETGRAHAVGDNGEMWLWRAETGLWERDENAPQDLAGDRYNGIAFQPGNPDRGYAITDAGRIFSYGKGWSEDAVPALDRRDSLLSIAFAGNQALVAAQKTLLVNDGSGWSVDQQAVDLLKEYGSKEITAVAGLPDGGAIAAGTGIVIVRDQAGSPWRLADHQLVGTVTALAATRDGDKVRGVAILNYPQATSDPFADVAELPVDEPGEVPTQYPSTPDVGWGGVVRETATGWADDVRSSYQQEDAYADCPYIPDAARALAIDAAGDGWVVGGDGTARADEQCGPSGGTDQQTSAIWRYGAQPQPPPAIARAQEPLAAGPARLLLGGHAACTEACATTAVPGHAPDRYLAAAIDVASELYATTGGPRAFLYTGTRVAPSRAGAAAEQVRFASLLGTATGRVPVYLAPSGTDAGADATTFGSAFSGLAAPQGAGAQPGTVSTAGVIGSEPAGSARTHYAFDTTGPEGRLRVVVIDNSSGSLAESDPHQIPQESDGQAGWLVRTLEQAKAQGVPTVVMGSRPLGAAGARSLAAEPGAGEGARINYHVSASDGVEVAKLLVDHGASAYLFDAAEQNLVTRVPENAGDTIPAIGSGALGYEARTNVTDAGLALVDFDLRSRNPQTNRVPVKASIVPVLEDLTIDPRDGTQVRRSTAALFVALGRRPRAGRQWIETGPLSGPDKAVSQPYISIPNETCRRQSCSLDLDYSFTSSNPEVGDFVKQDPARSTNPRAVFLGENDKPVGDGRSGLFCAFNPGETTIKVTAGGLAYSTTIKVLAGSPRRPCGTRPVTATEVPNASAPNPTPGAAAAPPSVAPNPTIAPPPPVAVPVPTAIPATPAAVVTPPPAAVLPSIPPLPVLPPPPAPLATPLVPIPPPPVGSIARPSPPGGATVRVYEEKREEEEAFEQSSASVKYERRSSPLPGPTTTVAVMLLAAAAGSTIVRRRPRRSRRTIARQEVR